MYSSFSIENFRLFDRLKVEPLSRVNLIAGPNNVGKTALLEALWLHNGPNIPELCLRLSSFRGIPGPNPRRFLHDVFYDFDSERDIVLSARGDWGQNERTLKISSRVAESAVVAIPATNLPDSPLPGSQESDFSAASPSEIVFDYTDEHQGKYVSTSRWVRSDHPVGLSPILPPISSEGLVSQQAPMPDRPSAVFLSARQRSGPEQDVNRFGEAELDGYSDQILDCLRKVDPRIKRLITIQNPPTPMIYVDVGLSRPVPMGFLGDGIGRLFSMALAFHNASDGAILIDEIENGLHYSKLKAIWERVHWLSREFDVQVFATTHSYECIRAAQAAFKMNEVSDEFAYIRLQRNQRTQRIECVPYDDPEAFDYAMEYGREVR